MIVDDLDVFRHAFAPYEADPPLIVDPDTMLTLPVTPQRLEMVSRNCRHVLQPLGVVQHPKLPARHRSNVAESAALLAMKKLLGLLASEGSYQTSSISR
jgi:transposase